MNCVSCGNNFECQANRGCWCISMPHLSEINPDSQTCLCPRCLNTKIALEINTGRIEITEEVRHSIAQLGLPENLEEGIDFTINPDGLMVFTSWYLLRRAYCCSNNCKHCPYK